MAEAIMSGAASSGIVEIGKWACKLMKRHIEYLFCYRQKVDELNEKISKQLAPTTKADIQSQVEAAERRGDTVTNEAEQWGKDVEEVERLNKENVDGAAAAPCFCWGYRFAKRAAHGLIVADELKKRAAGLVLFHPAPPPALEVRLPIDGFQELGTTASCMESVMKKLRDGTPGLIGVHGMGGVGKSFLAKKVLHRAQAEGLFKEVVFAVVSQDVNVKNIQQQIAEAFDVNVTQVSDSKGAAIVRERVMNSKGRVLLVLDDLWETLNTSLVGIPTEVAGGCANYKVVITARDRDVCNRMGCNEIIELTTLSEDESWELFRITSGVDDDAGVASGPGIIEMARSAAKKCDGLPLALTVLGKTTRGYRKAEEWKSVVKELDELRPINIQGVRDDLYKVLKLSFDRLRSEEERLCFLFLCLFPEDYCVSLNNPHYGAGGRPFEILLPTYTWYAVGEGFLEDKDVHTLADAQKRVGKILLKLKDSGLLIDGDIKDEDGKEYYESVKMHDVVRHVALQIAAGDGYGLYSKAGVALQQWPITISNLDMIQRISLFSSRCEYGDGLLPNDMDCPRLSTLTLANNQILKDIPDGFFLWMKALRVLDLTKASSSSLPSSLSCLTNLRVLFLGGSSTYDSYKYKYNDTDLLLISSLRNLEILSIRGGRNRNRSVLLFPTEMGNLARLRYLDLRDCQGLMMPPNVLSKLSNLEQLYMTGSFCEWRVQPDNTDRGAAFVELARLRRLTHLYVNVKNEECLWQEFESVDPWPNLTEFHINSHYFASEPTLCLTRGDNYNALLPGWLKSLMTRTKRLALINWGTLDIPASDFSLLDINGIGNPGMLFNASESFPSLKFLKVSNCCNITGIFASDNTLLPKVESIELEDLPQLTRICQEGDMRCHTLTRLVFYDCNSLTNIFCQEGAGVLCPNLRVLNVYRCNSLTHILPQLTRTCQEGDLRCPNLTRLVVVECNSLANIFGQEGDGVLCPKLTELNVTDCNSLTHIFPSWREIQCLKDLSLKNCRALTTIIATSEEIEEEEEANMLQQQDNSFLAQLEKLTLEHLPLLTKFHQAGNINNNSTPSVFIPSLQEIIVEYCPQLEALHLGPESLTKISIRNSGNLCNTLSSSSDFFSRAPLLKILNLGVIEELYENFLGMGVQGTPMLSALRNMRLDSLPQLISIWAGGDISYGSFQNLKELEIFNCNVMSIFLSKRQAAQCLPKLKKLKINNCVVFKGLIMFEEEEEDVEKAVLLQLKKINIIGCPNLEKALVHELLPSLENLKSIYISDCEKLRQVLDCNSRFQGQNPLLPLLCSIKLKNLPQLTSIWYGDVPNGSLPSLEEVIIDSCDQLSNLFTWRQARCLQQLETLRLKECRALKDVIMPMHVDEEEITDENKSLCNSGDMPSILLPALKYFTVRQCPLLKTPTLGLEMKERNILRGDSWKRKVPFESIDEEETSQEVDRTESQD